MARSRKHPKAARNRLYHTVRCLRQVLEPIAEPLPVRRGFVLRDGSRYVLTPPEGSWLDISTFEQLLPAVADLHRHEGDR